MSTRPGPDVVFHTAAYKHVPLMEGDNAWQAVLNNVVGTRVVAEAAVHWIEHCAHLRHGGIVVRATPELAALLRDAQRSRPTALLSWQGPRVPLTLEDATLLAWLMHDVGGVLSVRGAPRHPPAG